ncbi:hypothetical protein [Acidovorax sp. NCPPB 4044]|uniref:hypothetical protein n=1 Tax=Acidovorax sp. NCPPB 4044 TaxID=2940490 RepID=UPI002302049B|nr:hypothetical protein [Acidovorax sp. NCPPB 4044]MDA8522422.1 hypothetical protein [Acidovorax sp. NCPPB 4044]
MYIFGIRRDVDGRLLAQPLLGFSFFQWINNFVFRFEDWIVGWANVFFVVLMLFVIIVLMINNKNTNSFENK